MPRNNGNTWTSDAIQRGDFEAIRERAINEPDYLHERDYINATPLLNAIIGGSLDLVQFLIKQGADRTEIDASETPLMEAASMGHPEVVRLLLEHGADATMRDTIHGRTPLETAAYMSKGPDPDVVAYLTRENIRIDVDQLFGDMDLPAEQLEVIKNAVKETDLAENYINNATELARTGNHAEVIRILTELR